VCNVLYFKHIVHVIILLHLPTNTFSLSYIHIIILFILYLYLYTQVNIGLGTVGIIDVKILITVKNVSTLRSNFETVTGIQKIIIIYSSHFRPWLRNYYIIHSIHLAYGLNTKS
jgi:hypothetical protein